MTAKFHSGIYSGQIQAPASKSYLQRIIAIALLSEGESLIRGYSPSKDVDAAINIGRALGGEISVLGNTLTIRGINSQLKKNVHIDCNEAGLSARMFSPIAAVLANYTEITGKGSLLTRPMSMVEDALKQFGLKLTTHAGMLPLTIEGTPIAGIAHIDGSESSQLLTGLLIALTQLAGTSTLYVKDLKSIPYIMMTLEIMKKFGLEVINDNFKKFVIKGKQQVNPISINAEGDWSAASCHLVAGAINGDITINNLNITSLQADVKIMEALESCGAEVSIKKQSVQIKKRFLLPFTFDITHCPDLFPALAVLAANCEGSSHIKGIHRLIHKESNRLKSVTEEFNKLGIELTVIDDTAIITGGKIKGGCVSSHNDHRIAMAMAVMAINADSAITIEGMEAINKSYPDFSIDFKKALHKK